MSYNGNFYSFLYVNALKQRFSVLLTAWEASDDICFFLQPFEEVIEALSEDHRPSLHRMIPLRQCLINKCEVDETDSTVISELKFF